MESRPAKKCNWVVGSDTGIGIAILAHDIEGIVRLFLLKYGFKKSILTKVGLREKMVSFFWIF